LRGIECAARLRGALECFQRLLRQLRRLRRQLHLLLQGLFRSLGSGIRAPHERTRLRLRLLDKRHRNCSAQHQHTEPTADGSLVLHGAIPMYHFDWTATE
jgi:hypothetical protein